MAYTSNYIPQFNKFIIYPKGTAGDKNNHVEIELQYFEVAREISEERHQFGKFKNLNMFLQGCSLEKDRQWIMLESWSANSDLFFEFCEYLSKKYGFELDFDYN